MQENFGIKCARLTTFFILYFMDVNALILENNTLNNVALIPT